MSIHFSKASVIIKNSSWKAVELVKQVIMDAFHELLGADIHTPLTSWTKGHNFKKPGIQLVKK